MKPAIISSCIGLLILLSVSAFSFLQAWKHRTKTSKFTIGFNLSLAVICLMSAYVGGVVVSYDYYYAQGIICCTQQKHEDAIKSLKTALGLRNLISPLTQVLEKKCFGAPLLYSTEEEIRSDLAHSFLRLKDYDSAIEQYREVVLTDYQNFGATASLADTYFRKKDYENAKYWYDKLIAIKVPTKDFNYYFEMGRANMVLQNYESAVTNFETSLQFKKQEDRVKQYLALCNEELNRSGGLSGD